MTKKDTKCPGENKSHEKKLKKLLETEKMEKNYSEHQYNNRCLWLATYSRIFIARIITGKIHRNNIHCREN